MSTVRSLSLLTPVAAGIAVTAGGAATVLSVLGLLAILFVVRAVVLDHQDTRTTP